MKNLIGFLALQKLRFDLGQSNLSILTLFFAIIGAGDKIASLTGVQTRYVLAIVFPGALVLVWLIGWAMDRTGFFRAYQREMGERNPLLRQAASNAERGTRNAD